MSSDRARITFDPTKQYRGVVMQQGRVTLEADWNEAQEIENEALRADAQDIIGPCGTPDNGYAVTLSGQPTEPAFDFQIGEGTMYVGGERVFLPGPARYFQQSDWLNAPSPPVGDPPKTEFVYLLLREQEVSAVEDPDLREPALGGPDTAQRLRLIQRIVRLPSSGTDCPSALTDAETQWAAQGQILQDGTMRLLSQGRLQVSHQNSPPPLDPCEPASLDGYLGAENQLIRVQIAAYDPASGLVTLVWGLDNASFLSQIDTIAADAKTIVLVSSPPDAFHQPKQDQAVEVLRAAALLSNGQFAAESSGFVSTLAADYNSDLQAMTLSDALPADFLPAAQNPNAAPLFLRVWQERKTAKVGDTIVLGTTGLQITLTGAAFSPGDFWAFAVRLRRPQQIFPAAFLAAPQPPTGPREWACPLAVIAWTGNGTGTVTDCRNPFDNLVELSKLRSSGCCTVNVSPKDAPNLQAILDRWKGTDALKRQITVCFAPGRYELPRPLRLTAEHSHYTLEACHDGAILEAQSGSEANFLDGLIVLAHADNVTLCGLRFHLPLVPFLKAGGKFTHLETAATEKELTGLLRQLQVSVGLRPLHCANLTVRGCLFRFALGTENESFGDVFGAGIFAGSESWGLKVENCRFVHEEAYLRSAGNPFRLLFGYLLAPAAQASSPAGQATTLLRPASALVPSLLDRAAFEDNLFQGLSVAALIYSDLGTVTFRDNTAQDAVGGFWLFALHAFSAAAGMDQVSVDRNLLASAQSLRGSLSAVSQNTVLNLAIALARSYPLPPEFDIRLAVVPPKQTPKSGAADTPAQKLFDAALPAFAAPSPADTAPGTREKIDRVPLSDTPADPAPAALPPRLLQLSRLNAAMASFERLLLAQPNRRGMNPVLTLSGNAVSAIAKDGTASEFALLVWCDASIAGSTVMLHGNQFQKRSGGLPTVFLLLAERNILTANLMSNEVGTGSNVKPFALLLFPGAKGTLTAVTGNVLLGGSNLGQIPRSGFAAPLADWLFANASA